MNIATKISAIAESRSLIGAFALAGSIVIGGCSSSENPRLELCQKIATNLAGSVASWDSTDVKESGNQMTVTGSYTLGSGGSGNVACKYQRDKSNKDATDAPFETSPYQVSLNGERVPTAQVVKAGFAASKEQLGEVAAETKKQSAELAKQANQKAGEIAVKTEELASEAGEKLEDAAKEFGDKARKATVEAAEKVQEALQ